MIKSFQKGTLDVAFTIYVLMILSVLIVVHVLNFVTGWVSCNNYQSLTDRQTKYSIINGCFVNTKSGWIPKSEIRSENVE